MVLIDWFCVSAVQSPTRLSQSSGELSVSALRLHLQGNSTPHLLSLLLSTVFTVYIVLMCLLYVLWFFVFQGLNQDMRQHESTFAAEHLRMMANRNSTLENKVTEATRLR